MPIDLYSSVNKVSHFAFGSTVLNTLFGSTTITALIIATIMIISVMILYPAKLHTPLMVVFKMFIYIFIFTLLIVFVHDGVTKYTIEEKFQDKISADLMQGTSISTRDSVYGSGYVDINPSSQNQAGGGRTEEQTEEISIPQPPVSIVQPKPPDTEISVLGGAKPPPHRENPYR